MALLLLFWLFILDSHLSRGFYNRSIYGLSDKGLYRM